MTQAEKAPDSSLIVPLMKRAEAEGYGDPPPWPVPESDIPVLEGLTGVLLVAYVFDLPDRFEYVTPRICERLGLGARDLRALAVRNLTRRRTKPQVIRGNEALAFRMDGNLESSLLLVGHLWEQIGPQMPGDLIAAVPSRDTLAVTGSDVDGGIAVLTRSVDRVWRSSETRLLLTKSLFVRRGDSWEQLNPVTGPTT